MPTTARATSDVPPLCPLVSASLEKNFIRFHKVTTTSTLSHASASATTTTAFAIGGGCDMISLLATVGGTEHAASTLSAPSVEEPPVDAAGHLFVRWGKLCFSQDSTRLITADRQCIRAWAIESLADGCPPEALWVVHDVDVAGDTTGSFTSFALRGDNNFFAAGHSSGVAFIWMLRDRQLEPTLCATLHHNAQAEDVAVSSTDSLELKLPVAVVSVAFCGNPHLPLVATAGSDATIILWKVSTWQTLRVLHHCGNCSADTSDAFVTCVAFSDDGSLLISCGRCTDNGGDVKLWTTSNGLCVATMLWHSVPRCIAMNRGCSLLAVGHEDGSTTVTNLHNGSTVASHLGFGIAVSSITFSPIDERLITGFYDGSTTVRTVNGHSTDATLSAHTGPVTCVACSPCGQLLATTTADGAANIWWTHCVSLGSDDDSPAWTSWETATLANHHTADVTSVAFSSDYRVMASCGKDSAMKLWAVDSAECLLTVEVPFIPIRVSCTVTAAPDMKMECWGAAARSTAVVPHAALRLPQATLSAMIAAAASSPASPKTIDNVATSTKFAMPNTAPLKGSKGSKHIPSHELQQSSPVPRHSLLVTPRGEKIRSVRKSDVILSKDPIGSGSTALIYVAEKVPDSILELTTITKFVAKIYLPTLSPSDVDDTLKDLPLLRHPNIVRVVASISDVDRAGTLRTIGVLMERCGRTLHAEMHHGMSTPSIAQRLHWLYEVARAVYFAHSIDVIHSHISPEKILLVDRLNGIKTAKVFDFGSASVMQTRQLQSLGEGRRDKSLYMAPEYAQGSQPSKAADVFSFGMTMWSTLFPHKSHNLGNNMLRVAMAIGAGQRPPVEPLPRQDAQDVVDLLEKCWTQDPAKRCTMEEVLEVLQRHLESKVPATPSTERLWRNCLQQPPELVTALDLLRWEELAHPGISATPSTARTIVYKSEPITGYFHPCSQFIRNHVGPRFDIGSIQRVVMVNAVSNVESFLSIHNSESTSRLHNAALRSDNSPDPDTRLAISKLMEVCVQPIRPLQAQILFAWHGTELSNVDRICQDGPRALSVLDSGFFGHGSYFALEAWYAARFGNMQSVASGNNGERAVVLFAISVSQAYVVTVDKDYRLHEDPNTPHLHGFSRFYGGGGNSIALVPRHDCHFIPVAQYGNTHPLVKTPLSHNVDFQAVSEPLATAHELVISSHHRCVPLAVVYFKAGLAL